MLEKAEGFRIELFHELKIGLTGLRNSHVRVTLNESFSLTLGFSQWNNDANKVMLQRLKKKYKISKIKKR